MTLRVIKRPLVKRIFMVHSLPRTAPLWYFAIADQKPLIMDLELLNDYAKGSLKRICNCALVSILRVVATAGFAAYFLLDLRMTKQGLSAERVRYFDKKGCYSYKSVLRSLYSVLFAVSIYLAAHPDSPDQ